MSRSTAVIISVSVTLTVIMAVAFAGGDRTVFLPDPVTPPHARFEAGCHACHDPWDGPSRGLCLGCHGRALENDTHSPAKIAAPRKAATPEILKNIDCVNCHREHRDTGEGGYTGPSGFCLICHPQGLINPSHDSFDASSCQSPSCHSYHSNFTVMEYETASSMRLKEAADMPPKPAPAKAKALDESALNEMREDDFYVNNPVVSAKYEIGPHAGTEATCKRCHETETGFTVLEPSTQVCDECHEIQTRTFGQGRHGAAAANSVTRFLPGGERVGCGDCHDAHSLRMDKAGFEACLECHETSHAKNYVKSGHYRYLSDPVFRNKPMTGVDCAGCHMPRHKELRGATDHNETQSSSSIKYMATRVCARCHGLEFSLRSLYDEEVAESNFTFMPSGNRPAGLEYAFGMAERP